MGSVLFWLGLPAAFAAGFLLSVQLERLIKPAAPGLSRPFGALLLHGGLWSFGVAIALAITGRPVFCCLLCLSAQFLVIQVSNAKYRALREPFIFSDFGIFSQTLKHPRLYLPFLGVGRFLLVCAVAGIALVVGLWLEPPSGQSLVWAMASSAAASVLLPTGLLLSSRPLLDPLRDISRSGLFATIAHYWALEKTSQPTRRSHLPSVGNVRGQLPDIVIIQSESFFDPRDYFPGIRSDVLGNWDDACTRATLRGKLTVPAWGANTMRPEFAFLTGIEPTSLGIHRFNPYRRVARHPIRALPTVLREVGYTTTCIHPHPARFFRRDRAFPNMGFEHFIDVRAFHDADKFGPYIGDEAVTDKLMDEMRRAVEPALFFVITMENHGPLHLEDLHDSEYSNYFDSLPPALCRDLGVYLRHLKNADLQLGRLRRFLHGRTRPFVLVFYGEHLPSMPAVYDAVGFPDGRTDYIVESSSAIEQRRVDLEVSDLASQVVKILKLESI